MSNPRYLCDVQGLTDEIASSILSIALTSCGLHSTLQLLKADKSKQKEVYRRFAFISYDSPHFATKKEVSFYSGIPYSSACELYQEFLTMKRSNR